MTKSKIYDQFTGLGISAAVVILLIAFIINLLFLFNSGLNMFFIIPFAIATIALIIFCNTNKVMFRRLSMLLGIPALIYLTFMIIVVPILFITQFGSARHVFESRISRMNRELPGLHEIFSGHPVDLRASNIEITDRGMFLVRINVWQTRLSASDSSVAEGISVQLERYFNTDEFISWMLELYPFASLTDFDFPISVVFRHPSIDSSPIAWVSFEFERLDGYVNASRIVALDTNVD